MARNLTRRGFLEGVAASLPVATLARTSVLLSGLQACRKHEELFGISLAEWSLHRTLSAGDLDNLDFPAVARNEFEIDAVEYVNQFFKDKARDTSYLSELKMRADDNGVSSLIIMCDGEGALGDPDDAARTVAVENHHSWVEAAQFLGCHSIRVNAQSAGTPEEQRDLAVDGLGRLTEFAAPFGINVVVENHGGISSNGEWLASVIVAVGHSGCGTLPDFGNFRIEEGVWYDRYQGMTELMPFAKAVSAKSNVFDQHGNERDTDYEQVMRIVLEAGYRGFVGIEYEGSELPEMEGIRATKALLEKTRATLEQEYQ